MFEIVIAIAMWLLGFGLILFTGAVFVFILCLIVYYLALKQG